MSEPGTDRSPPGDAEAAKEKEPFWVDVMKSMGCGMALLALTIVVGGALAIAIIAPWGRASFDCSIYCVIGRYFENLF